jgi:hypothetical protein
MPRRRASSASSSALGRAGPERGLTTRKPSKAGKSKWVPPRLNWADRPMEERPFRADHLGIVSDRGYHSIEDDLSETWLEDWAGAGVAELEDYLAKHAAFTDFLQTHDS